MVMSDPIADMLTRIRNAGKAKFNSVDIPGAKLKMELARVLRDEGFIRNYKFIIDKKQGILRVYLKYTEEETHAIYGLERVSKPSRRVYAKSKDVNCVGLFFIIFKINTQGALLLIFNELVIFYKTFIF